MKILGQALNKIKSALIQNVSNKKRWIFLLMSSIFYAVPFIFSMHYWPIIFLFPIPLFFCLSEEPCGFWEGFIWGAVSIGLHLAGVFYSIMFMAQGSLLHKMIPWIGGVGYFGLYTGLWFFLTASLVRRIHRRMIQHLIWLFSVWLLFISFDHVCLAVFNCVEGLFLLSPLLPLAEYLPALRLMVYITKPGLLLLFFLIPWSLVYGVTERKWLWCLAGGMSALLWLSTCLLPARPTSMPSCFSYIGYIANSFYEVSGNKNINGANASLLGIAVKDNIEYVLQRNPNLKLIVLPESALVHCPLSDCENALAYWTHEKLGKEIVLLIGAFRRDIKGLHNTLYVIKDGCIVDFFDKRHAMLLTENIAPWWNFGFLHDLYFKDWASLAVSTNERKPLQLFPEQAFVPYICSELFFKQFPDDTYPQLPIMVLCNDMWVKTPYIRRLMALEAHLKAVQWQRFIVYISFFYTACMSPS